MSSSFSTLAKVATLFLSRYKCPGPPCESLRLGGWDCTLGVSNHCSPNTCRRKRARPWRWHPPPLPHSQAGRAEPYLAENQHLPDFGPLVVDIQLLLYLLWGGRGVSAAPTICVLPPLQPRDQKAEGSEGTYPECPRRSRARGPGGDKTPGQSPSRAVPPTRPEMGLGALTEDGDSTPTRP